MVLTTQKIQDRSIFFHLGHNRSSCRDTSLFLVLLTIHHDLNYFGQDLLCHFVLQKDLGLGV